MLKGKNFKMEVRNIFMMQNYDIADVEKEPIIWNFLGREGLHFTESLTIEEQEYAKTANDCSK